MNKTSKAEISNAVSGVLVHTACLADRFDPAVAAASGKRASYPGEYRFLKYGREGDTAVNSLSTTAVLRGGRCNG